MKNWNRLHGLFVSHTKNILDGVARVILSLHAHAWMAANVDSCTKNILAESREPLTFILFGISPSFLSTARSFLSPGCSRRGLSSVQDMDAEAGNMGTQQPPQAVGSTRSAAVLFGRSSSLHSAPGAESFDNTLRVRCAARCFCFTVAGSCACCSKLTHRCSWLCRSSRI
jgi:hypothetical protein